jgi:hypothetical protein
MELQGFSRRFQLPTTIFIGKKAEKDGYSYSESPVPF